jgi:lipopolysaccharide/colanic/teichoic acid biosynthesis glycosyltransferase
MGWSARWFADLQKISGSEIKKSAGQNGIYRKFIKRLLDLILASLAFIILSPVLLIFAGLIRLKIGKPVFFQQKRPGLNEKIFTIYKFRTMTDDQDDQGVLLPDSRRINKFGAFLRATSLDELPELFNIIRGDMSIIGPRPLLISYLPYYTETERIRHTIRPGLTGWAQVNGRNYLDWDSRLAKDIEYARRCSFLFDVKIIILTVLYVLNKSDISVDSRAVEPNFAAERQQKNIRFEND